MNWIKIPLTLMFVVLLFSVLVISSINPVLADDVSTLSVDKRGAFITPQKTASVAEYVTTKQNVFNSRLQSNPQKLVTATISFTNWSTIDDVNNIISNKEVTLFSIFTAFRGQYLGFGELIIRPNDDVKAKWDSIKEQNINQLNSELSVTKGLTDAPNSEQLLQIHKEMVRKKIVQLESNTPIIYAIRVTATLDSLAKLQTEPNIRLIDIADAQNVAKAESNGIPETDIIISGVIPDDLDKFTYVPKATN